MRYLNTATRTADITNAISWLILEGGIPGLSLRRIAARARISIGTLYAHLDDRERILRVCAYTFAESRITALEQRLRERGLAGALPSSADEVEAERVWQAWCELGRTYAGIGRAVARHDEHDEHRILGYLVDERVLNRWEAPSVALEPEARAVLLATIRGLRALLVTQAARETDAQADTQADTQAAQRALAAASAFARSSLTIRSGSAAE